MKKKLPKSQSAKSAAQVDWSANDDGEFIAHPPPPDKERDTPPATAFQIPKHLPLGFVTTKTPPEIRTKLDDPEALARLVGVLGMQATRENASKAVRFLCECAIVLGEARTELERVEAFNAEAYAGHRKQAREFSRTVGIDIAKQTFPISRKKFIGLLNRNALTIRGKRIKGDKLWREFLRDVLSQQLRHPATDAEIDESEANFERLELDEMGFRIFASQWAQWSRKNRRQGSPFVTAKRSNARGGKS